MNTAPEQLLLPGFLPEGISSSAQSSEHCRPSLNSAEEIQTALEDDRCRGPLLHTAVFERDVELVSLLLESGADPDSICPETGTTPLHLVAPSIVVAIDNVYYRIVELLVRAGADVNRKDEYGWSPLDNAAESLISAAEELKLAYTQFCESPPPGYVCLADIFDEEYEQLRSAERAYYLMENSPSNQQPHNSPLDKEKYNTILYHIRAVLRAF